MAEPEEQRPAHDRGAPARAAAQRGHPRRVRGALARAVEARRAGDVAIGADGVEENPDAAAMRPAAAGRELDEALLAAGDALAARQRGDEVRQLARVLPVVVVEP